MAPVSVAEHQMKRRENVKQLGLYKEHKAKNREYNKKYRKDLKIKSETVKQEDQTILTDQERTQERLQKKNY